MENSMKAPQKTKNRATIWSSNPAPGYTSEKMETLIQSMHANVHMSTIYNSHNMEVT